MQKHCLKCGQANPAATGDEMEACPGCGAIYSRVEAAMAARAAAAQRRTTPREPQDEEETQTQAATSGLTQRQIVGLVGAAVLAIGVFMPLLSGPLGMSVNYFSNGKGDGILVLAMAGCSAALVLARQFRLLWATGAVSLAVLAFTFNRVRSGMSEVKAQMDRDLQGNPFRGLADAAMESVQMQWGWAVLAIGAALILGCAAMKKG